jgi:periodic tryptophan protein 2
LFTSFERELAYGKGRFVLEKKSKFQMQADSRVVSCDIAQGQNPILVLGQSNGVFSIYNLDTLQSIHSF